MAAAFVQNGVIYTYAQLPESETQPEARAFLYKGEEEISDTLTPYKTETITDDTPVSYMVLLDVSGSVKAYREQISLFADCFWSRANGDLRFYLGEIGDALTISDVFTDKDRLLEAINAAAFDAPYTNLYASVSEAVAFYDAQPRADGQVNIIVMITDGKDTSGKNAKVVMETLETSAPVMICAVAVGADASDEDALAELADATCGIQGILTDKASAERLADEITQRVNMLTFAKFKFPSELLGQEDYSLEVRYFDAGILSPKYIARTDALAFIGNAASAAPSSEREPEEEAPPATPEQIATPSAVEEDFPKDDDADSAGSASKGAFDLKTALLIAIPTLALLLALLLALFIARRFGKNKTRKRRGPEKNRAAGRPPAGEGVPIAAEFATGDILRLILPDGGEILIGRDRDCGIALSDDSAEPKNSRLFLSGGAVFIEDLNSTNGTYVDGMRIHAPSKLRSNCEIRIGAECFVIKF
jgi:hypothetical protein